MKLNTTNAAWLATMLFLACGGDDGPEIDAGPGEVTTAHCDYEPTPSGANATGTVEEGTLTAGAAEKIIDIPVGTALGGYTARAGFLGTAGAVDLREVEIAGSFNPSIGVEAAPRVKAVVLTAGSETVAIVRLDAIFPYEGMTLDIAEELGPEFRGKVMVVASHTHSGWAQYTGHTGYQVGAGTLRDIVYRRYIDTAVEVVEEALAGQRAAKIGILSDLNFDPDDVINRDRRGENDLLPGGDSDDSNFFMIRIDGTDDEPIAIVPVYGVHGTIGGEDNSYASSDAIGALERVLEEKFDSEIVVMHLQGAGGDVSPAGHGNVNCDNKPGNEDDPCFNWLVAEGHGRVAADIVYSAWQAAGASMTTELGLEMLTRSVELGPKAETFAIRDGDLEYAPFEHFREADQAVWAGSELLSPIDEFNAPVGAALCEEESPLFPNGLMPGTEFVVPYGSCVRADTAGEILGQLLQLDFETSPTQPICQSTRTLVSALRIGDHVIGTIPGELTVMLAKRIRDLSPVAADKTIVLGYAQGFTGYSLTPEDWVSGGYEASTNFWGPLEAEYLAERTLELMNLAVTPQREDGQLGGADRISTPIVSDADVPLDDPAPMSGTIPSTTPERVWLRTGVRTPTQPDATVERVAGLALFTWIGEDPKIATPIVTLQRETAPDSGVYEDVRRRSGRLVRDAELLLTYTALPLRREDAEQTHYWSVEWQAVPWLGAVGPAEQAIDTLEAVGALPIGRYRFHVAGASYALDSAPFEVIPEVLAVSASGAGNNLTVTVSHTAAKGYRLLDLSAASNGTVPLRNQTVDIVVDRGEAGTIEIDAVVLDSNGSSTQDIGVDTATVESVTVVDAYENSGSRTL